jgi:hypothetical protein
LEAKKNKGFLSHSVIRARVRGILVRIGQKSVAAVSDPASTRPNLPGGILGAWQGGDGMPSSG